MLIERARHRVPRRVRVSVTLGEGGGDDVYERTQIVHADQQLAADHLVWDFVRPDQIDRFEGSYRGLAC